MDEREQRAARDAARRLQELERTLGKNWMADIAAAAGAVAEAQRRYVISGFDSIVRGWAGTWDHRDRFGIHDHPEVFPLNMALSTEE